MSLQIKNLSFGYHTHRLVLQDLSIEIESGSRHGILGVNGAGKTTLFQVLSGWQHVPQGHVFWKGEVLQKSDVSLLEAEPWFYPYMTGHEYLRFLKDEPLQIERWNQLFDLPLERLAEEYSTGMKKKLGFMGVLLQEERPLLILDEPFNGVDFESNEKMMLLLRQNRLANRTIVVSSHILPTLTHVCDRISVLRAGKIERTWEKENFGQLEAEVQQSIHNEVQNSLRWME